MSETFTGIGKSTKFYLQCIESFRLRYIPNETVVLGIVIGLTYFATAVLGYYLDHLAGGNIFYPCPAILFVALHRGQKKSWAALIAFSAAADAAATHLMASAPLMVCGLFAIANMAEASVVAVMVRRFAPSKDWFLSWRWAGVFALACALAGILGFAIASIGMFVIYTALGKHYDLIRVLEGAAVDSAGLLLIGYFLMCWTERDLRRRVDLRVMIEALIGTTVVAITAHFAFSSSAPLLFVIFPLLALITVRTGLPGATLGASAVTLVAAWHTAHHVGPIATMPGLGMGQPLLVLQLFFLMAVLSSSPISIVLMLREKLMDKLKQESEISRAALDNMAEGLCMIDSEQRLITTNPQFGKMYDLPARLLRPGTPFGDILKHHLACGLVNNAADLETGGLEVDQLDCPDQHREIQLTDGRILDIHRRPLASGGWVATYEDVTESRRAASQIAYLANHDPLTGLANRAFFRERLQEAMTRAERGQEFALHCLDLDRFKTINDTKGHAVGDELLKQVAERLRNISRKADFIARLGGDEFAIIQGPLGSPDDASRLARRIVDSLSQPYRIAQSDILSATSVGIALAPGDTTDMADLLQKADLALYRAKADERGTFRFFESGMDSVLRKRRLLEAELRAALQNGEFELYYQPILDLKSDEITSFEALLRWEHPIRGIISSAEFIPVAEDSGLIIPLGEWALQQACRDAATWPENVSVAVNVSPVQFRDLRLVSSVVNALARSGLDPKRLEIEVTESALIHNTDSALKILNEFHDLGISISMDDFGTGYSGLTYLRTFPFSKIKIDQSFVHDITQSDCAAIVRATLQLTETLGMSCVAEGVETAEQLAILEAKGCDNIQGYYVGKPLPARNVPYTLNRFGEGSSQEFRHVGGLGG